LVTIAPGATATVELQLAGAVDVTDGYRLDLLNQPMANPDRSRVSVGSSVAGAEVVAADGLEVRDGRAEGEGVLDTDQAFLVRFGRAPRS
jgi:hypothetical protein